MKIKDKMGVSAVDAVDEAMMRLALELAQQAADAEEVPVGAVVTLDDTVVGDGRNGSIERNDPSAHAEIAALRQACRKVGNYRLPGATLYVTLEPCLMCVGAAVAARVARLVFGAADPKTGCLGGAFDARELTFLNHRFAVTSGVCAAQSRALILKFFQARR